MYWRKTLNPKRKSEKAMRATRENVKETKGKTRKGGVGPEESTPNENDNHN